MYTIHVLSLYFSLTAVTNLAHAYRDDPTTFSRVKTVVWMGGALDHPGNTSPSAEFNCFADPYAADQILTAVKAGAFDLVMAPLDITTPHQIPFDDLIHASYPTKPDPSLSPLRHFVSAMLGRVRMLQASFGLPDSMEMHDPVAVWYAVMHAVLKPGELAEGWEVKKREFQIERIGELTRGMCVVDRRGTGEVGVERTKSKVLNGDAGRVQAEVKKDRDGSNVVESKALPRVLVKTPGSEELRRILLSRVFGPAT